MSCLYSKEITFAVYEFDSTGKEHNTGKTFSINKEENDAYMKKIGYGPSADRIDDYGIILALFTKLYTFDIGPNGFRIIWDENTHESGNLYWSGPREPAIRCGGNWWRIKRIT